MVQSPVNHTMRQFREHIGHEQKHTIDGGSARAIWGFNTFHVPLPDFKELYVHS
jgi:hypothetical protein